MKAGPQANMFGQFIIHQMRDAGIEHFDRLAASRCKAPSAKQLQKSLKTFSESQRAIIRDCVIESIDSAMQSFLFAIQEVEDKTDGPHVMVHGKNVARQSDGLHGETFGPDGWIAKYSQFPEVGSQ